MSKNNEKTKFESIGGYKKRGTFTSSSTTWKIKKRDVRWSGGECALEGAGWNFRGCSKSAVRRVRDAEKWHRKAVEELRSTPKRPTSRKVRWREAQTGSRGRYLQSQAGFT